MKIKDAIKTAEKHQRIRDLRKDGYFLNSCMSILDTSMKIEKWIFTYYNEENNTVVEVLVDGGVEFKEPGEPMKPTKKEVFPAKIKTNPEKMLEKAAKEFKKFKQPLSQLILSLQDDGKVTWRFNFITKILTVITVRIDAQTGKILSTEQQNLSKPC